MKKIAVIGVYFGPLPSNFRLWLRSCEMNKTIDFLLFTDQTVENVPENMTIIASSLNEISELASMKLGLPIRIEKPYKICDFKPVYGKIFSDYLGGSLIGDTVILT